MEFVLIAAILMVGSVMAIGLRCVYKGTHGKNAKRIAGINVLALFGMLICTTILLFGRSDIFAAGDAAGQAAQGTDLRSIGAALSTGLACIGAGIAVAMSASAALGAISENEKLLGKTLIFVGLAEGIAIYGLIISILILG